MSSIMEAGFALGRRLVVIDAPLAEIPRIDATQLGKSFLAAFLLDGVEWQSQDLSSAIDYLIERGANSLLFHGDRASEAEFLADRAIVERVGDRETAENVIVTISSKRPIAEFLEEATVSIAPAADYLEGWDSDVFFCVAGTDEARAVAEMLR